MNRIRDLAADVSAYLQFYRDLGVGGLGVRPPSKGLRQPQADRASGAAPQARPAAGPAAPPAPPRVYAAPVSLFDSPPAGRETLEAVRDDLGDCRRCELAADRTHIVFGAGDPNAALMFVGEAPGADEDAQGLPFVGRAGQLLTRIIEAIGMRREDVYICNILKCRPPRNRSPETDEIAACEPFLLRQIASVQPRVICALGAYGAQVLLRTKEPISRLRGQFIDYRGVKLMATFHPAYLLRNPNEKRKVWEDVQKIRDYLLGAGGSSRAGRPR
ncbi:MAG: uracil-DNA glycosylase [Acidobacteriota bacterium]